MSQTIQSTKLSLLESILMIDDIEELNRIAAVVGTPTKRSFLDIQALKIEAAPSFEELYQSQGSKTIDYHSLPTPVDWGYTLDEVLEAL